MHDNTPSIRSKVATDLFWTQLKWTFWFVPIVLISYPVLTFFFAEVQELELTFLSFLFQPAKIYMLVLGIFSIFAFFPYYVKNGVTRKDYFTGSALAAAVLAVTIVLLSVIIMIILQLIGNWTAYSPGTEHLPFLQMSSKWVFPAVVVTCIILSYYIGGWMIALGFYRFGGWGVLLFILIGLLYLSAIDLLWEERPTLPVPDFLPAAAPTFSLGVSLICNLVLIIAGLFLLFRIIRRARIKLD
ncbi:hypothetical protein [Alteribacillus iranensis]|uniref:ABC-2 type transport system permease protein n=1 Tax=Alteribacillus iranensis TaxID=930128 RepID=A0A1I2FGX8_9BACI|nr:hypothetical protein [Alteribacillus iranensis]SFF04672.1 hypothetical protein SAMN05192532_11229 [Alteribacillus iranensis]